MHGSINIKWRTCVLHMGSRHESRQLKKIFVFWRSTYILYVMDIVSKHDSLQLMKLVCYRFTYSVCVLYRRSKLPPNEENRVLTLDVQPISDVISVLTFDIQTICTEYGLQTCLAPTEEIQKLQFSMQRISDEYDLETLLAPSDLIRLLSSNMQNICAEYGIQT